MSDANDRPLHPVAELAAMMLAKNSPTPPHVLDEASADELRAELARLAGNVELRRATGDLIRLACHLDTAAGSPDAAAAILRVLESTVEPLRALDAAEGEALAGATEEGSAAKRDFDRFRGSEEAPKAPKIGEGAPQGSVKLGSLDYPKRG